MHLAGTPRVGAASYQPRSMEGTILHRVVREHFETCSASIAAGPGAAAYLTAGAAP